jgi:hypothetical protein
LLISSVNYDIYGFLYARNAYNILVGKPETKRPPGRIRRRWEDNIQIYLKEIVCGLWAGFNRIRIGSSGMLFCHGNELSGFIKGGECID